MGDLNYHEMGVLALLRSNYGKSPFAIAWKCFTASFYLFAKFRKISLRGGFEPMTSG